MKRRTWIFTGIIVWLVLVITAIPAVWAMYIVQSAVPGWRADSISGNFWQGRAENSQLNIDGKPLDLGSLQWRLQPLGLLWLRPCVSFTTTLDSQTTQAQACVSLLSQTVTLHDAHVSLNAALLEPWIALQLAGDIDLRIRSLELSDNALSRLDGALQWRRAQAHNSLAWISLGNLQARLSDDQAGGLASQWQDIQASGEEGPVAMDMKVQLPVDGGVIALGNVTPRGSAAPEITQILQTLFESDAKGGYRISWRG